MLFARTVRYAPRVAQQTRGVHVENTLHNVNAGYSLR